MAAARRSRSSRWRLSASVSMATCLVAWDSRSPEPRQLVSTRLNSATRARTTMLSRSVMGRRVLDMQGGTADIPPWIKRSVLVGFVSVIKSDTFSVLCSGQHDPDQRGQTQCPNPLTHTLLNRAWHSISPWPLVDIDDTGAFHSP